MQDFKSLCVKYSEGSKNGHMLFIKPHSVRERVPEKPPEKTLFVVGLPPCCNEEVTKELFSKFGKVKSVFIHKQPTNQVPPTDESKFFPLNNGIKGFKVAYVVFDLAKDLRQAMNYDGQLVYPKKNILSGLDKWIKNYNNQVPDIPALEEDIKNYMIKYDEEMESHSKKEKEVGKPDEDGWMTVTRRGKNPGFARKESVKNQLEKKLEVKKEKTQLNNFYTFQIKESKMKNLVAMRKVFEEDKKRIAALKESRRFKPF